MNIHRLNEKLRFVLDLHDLVNCEPLENLRSAKLGISEDFLYHKILRWDSPTRMNLPAQLKSFLELLETHSIKPVLLLSFEPISEKLDDRLLLQTLKERNREQLRELLQNRAVIEALIPKKLLLKLLDQLRFEYLVTQNSSAQLRFLFTTQQISGIAAELSYLEYCHGFKELTNLIIDITPEGFEWIDVKMMTAKCQLSLDSLAEMYSLYHYCQHQSGLPCFTEEFLEATSKTKYNLSYEELSKRQCTDLLYSVCHGFFAGKMSLEQRIQKNQDKLAGDWSKVAQFLKHIKERPYMDLHGDYIQKDGVQYPTELNVFWANGIGLSKDCSQSLYPSLEYEEMLKVLLSPSYLYLDKLNLAYCQGRIFPKQVSYQGKDCSSEMTMQNSINYYYYSLKLASRKGSLDSQSEQPANAFAAGVSVYSVNLRFLHHIGVLFIDSGKGSLFASALRKVKNPVYFEPLLLYLYLIDSPIKMILFTRGGCSERIALLTRFFCIMNRSQEGEQDMFTSVLDLCCNYFSELYDSLLISQYLEQNNRRNMENYIRLGKSNPFRRVFRMHPDFWRFVEKQMSREEFAEHHDLQYYKDGWEELLNVFRYIEEKQGMKYPQLKLANDYFIQQL